MAKKNTVTDDVQSILNNSVAQAQAYYHNIISTAHLFLALFSFLGKRKSTDRYSSVYNNLREIINEYGINGEKFKEAFLKYCPRGTEPMEGETLTITTTDEIRKVKSTLDAKAVSEKRQMEVEDLIIELFSDRAYTIATIFAEMTGSDMKSDEMRQKVVTKFKKTRKKTIKELEDLSGIMTNINTWVAGHPQKVVGMGNEISALQMALAGRSIRNAVLTGPAGCGKTMAVYELAQRINEGNVPKFLEDKIIFELSPAGLLAGARYVGDFQERLLNIIEIAKAHPEVIIFVDEAHTLMGCGQSEANPSGGASDILKPFITRGELQLIMCTTSEEYTKYIAADKAFARRFHQILINEPNEDELREILKGILPVETKFFNKEIQESLLEHVIDLAKKYTLDLANPAKAINMLELACAYSKVFEEKKQMVDVDDVIRSVRLKYNIHISDDKYEDTRRELFSRLLGQDAALNQICRNIKTVEEGLYDPEKPKYSMLFSGPSGTGKTEAAKVIAEKYFGSKDNLIKINMGEYSSEIDVTKLTGSSAGYVGYDDEPALLKQVREKPNSVILFDECEKAHSSIWKILLNILDEGYMTDNKGNKVSFRNCIIIFTTNLGCTKDTGKEIGIGFVKTMEEDNTDDIMKAIEDYFRPEFLGRLDDIVIFKNLTREIIDELIDRYVKFYSDVSGKKIKLTKEDRDIICEKANIETAGARGLMKAVRKQITDKDFKECTRKEALA